MANVVFDHVTKQFGSVKAVNDLLLNVQDEEFLVLVGPSGCGKSTALRCLAGLEEITSGDITIDERVVTHVPPKDRDIAMVFQNYALYPHMSVHDNLAFGLKLRHTPREEITRRVNRTADILGIGELLERKPRQLSGGQRQRVALGRAIVREPKVFLMDEPLSNLDAKLRVQTRAEIIKLQQRLGTTTVYVTHDQVEAMTMGHRIAVMNFGVLQQLDTPQELYDHPTNLFVATFIGSPAMNVFPTEVVQGEGGVRLLAEGVSLTVPYDRVGKLGGVIGTQVMTGIRPEHFRVRQNGGSNDGRGLKLPVDLVEPLGSEKLVHMRGPDGENLVARLEPDAPVRAGEVLDLTVDIDHLHAFDSQTQEALN